MAWQQWEVEGILQGTCTNETQWKHTLTETTHRGSLPRGMSSRQIYSKSQLQGFTSWKFLWGDSTLGLALKTVGDQCRIVCVKSGDYVSSFIGTWHLSRSGPDLFTIYIGYNPDEQAGNILISSRYEGGSDYNYAVQGGWGQPYTQDVVSAIWGEIPPTYTWQSVPSVSGKNGILQSLSTLVNINDGNPVSGASASDVNIIPASVVSGMIQTGASDVIVSFEIPQLTSGTYDSIKLVGKRGGIPRSKTDGEFIETLSDSDTSKTLTGLTKGYTYWFVIFAEDSKGSSSESDPYPYKTGEGESIVFFEIDLGQGGKDIVRYDASKSIGNHKQGELYGNYSIANDELSTNGYIYWDYDATENPKSIPADCCLYFEYDTLFTGDEGYLDWFVLDANNDQQIYWCYDTKYTFLSNRWYNCLVVAEVKNGYIKRYKYVLDGIEISHDTANIKMPCTDAEGSIGISEIYFRTTQPTKIKNMSIYYDFSTYTEAGGGGGGGSGASGSNSVS